MNTSHARRFALIVMVAGLLALVSPLGFTAAQPQADDDPGSQVRFSNLALANKLFAAVFNGDDADAANLLVSEDAVIRTSYGEFAGPQGLLDYVASMKRSYPDARFEITNISVSDDSVVVSWTMTASKLQVDPYEQAIDVLAERSGETTIIVADGKAASVSLDTGATVFTNPTDAVAVADPRPCPPTCNF